MSFPEASERLYPGGWLRILSDGPQRAELGVMGRCSQEAELGLGKGNTSLPVSLLKVQWDTGLEGCHVCSLFSGGIQTKARGSHNIDGISV